MRLSRLPSVLAATIAAVMLVGSSVALLGYANVVYYTGQGLSADGFGSYDLKTELCGVENGAEVDGPYLLWVLTATAADHANITGPWGTAEMTKKGNGGFHYVSGWYDPSTLFPEVVFATYDGRVKNVQLVISHGCRPFQTGGAWCSPGFWEHAQAGAWTLVGKNKTDLFNASVYNFWYGATFAADPTLETVLNNAQIYSGSPLPGTSGYPLNAFNATGAYLTDNIPGYHFDINVMMAGGSDACPIDHFGHFKE
jgi:hypothetical protein